MIRSHAGSILFLSMRRVWYATILWPRAFLVVLMYCVAPCMYYVASHVEIDSDADTTLLSPETSLLRLRRSDMIHVIEFCCCRTLLWTAARLSVLSDFQLCQLAIIAVGPANAMREASSLGMTTLRGFKYMMKAFTIEHGGIATWDGRTESLNTKSREHGFIDTYGPTRRRALQRQPSLAVTPAPPRPARVAIEEIEHVIPQTPRIVRRRITRKSPACV